MLYTGESGLGKSTLINTLFNTTLYPGKEPLPPSAERPQTVSIESISAGPLFLAFKDAELTSFSGCQSQTLKKMVFVFV